MKVKVFPPRSKKPAVYYNVFDISFTGENYFRMMSLTYVDKYTGEVKEYSLFTHGAKIEIED